MNIYLTDEEILEVQFSVYRNIKHHKKEIRDAQKLMRRRKCYTDNQEELIKQSIETHEREIEVLESALKKLGG